MELAKKIAAELGKSEQAVQNVIDLLDQGNTIPFIARYRKEAHGAMDDTSLRALEDRLKYLRSLEQRKAEVTSAIDNQGKLTEELAASIDAAVTLSEVEDLYRPYKAKRRTRATIAREKGLEMLATLILSQARNLPAPEELAKKYIDPDKGVSTVEEAIAGASDIIAEDLSDSAEIRTALKRLFRARGKLVTKAAKEEDSVYRNYYDWSQSVSRVMGHQILAVNRGEKEEFLKVTIDVAEGEAMAIIFSRVLKPGSKSESLVRSAAEDAYNRLILPSVRNEIRSELTDTAAEGAIHNFALNLRPLLMQPPVKGHITMGLDPGYRMGCKVAVIDGTGKVLDTAVVHPTLTERGRAESIVTLAALIRKHKIEHIAIGNGTASRETEAMTVDLLKQCPGVTYTIVSEAGASVYSASKLAAEEFPQYDVNLRSAVSIARRLQDPLAELVKIDPKAIGVGQYQHDMPQARLDESLKTVVEDCVNAVGVDVNTASPSLLKYVSGLTAATAKNIVTYREENGPYTTRSQLLKVPKLGPKAFEQCAGFLRVPESRNVFDNTGVHPESYSAAKTLLGLVGIETKDIKNGYAGDLPELLKEYGVEKAAEQCGVGVPTLQDIAKELSKPGRDPRDTLPPPIFRTDLPDIKDLKPGMVLLGTVRNVIDFGAFVDIGVHQDGLVHISEISDTRINHPSSVLSVGDTVKVLVLNVDEGKKRISLSIKQAKGLEITR